MRGGYLPDAQPRRLGRACFFLLALLLAAAFATPKAWAQAWEAGGQYHDEVAADNLTAAGVNTATSDTYTELAFQRRVNGCTGINIAMVVASRAIFSLALYDGSSKLGGGNNFRFSVTDARHYRIDLRRSYTHSGAATLTVSLAVDAINCSGVSPARLNVAWPVTISDPWTDAGSHSDEAASAFSPVIIGASTARTATGLAFHQSPSCRQIDVALAAGAPDSVELVRYDGNSPATTTALSNIHMENGHADDNHVKLMFKAGATLTAGSVLTMTVNGTRNSSCTGNEPATNPSIEWKVTVGTPASWVDGGDHDATAADDLTLEALNAATTDTYSGLAFHRTAAGCDARRAVLASSSRTIFGLHKYDGSTRETSSLANDVPFTGTEHVRVYLRSSYQQHTARTLQASLVVSGDCASATRPAPLTLAWAVTVTDPWTDQGSHSDEAASAFSPLIIGASTSRTATGLAFHQSPACRQIDVALAAGAPDSVELVRYDGNSPATTTALSNIHMESGNANDNHVKLMFKAGATLTAGSVLTMTVNGTRNASCSGSGNRSYEWKVTVGTPASWVDGGDHDGTAVDNLRDATLNAATTDTYTGLAFHRTAAGCDARRAVLASSSRTIFGLHKYDGGTRETSSLANDVPFTGTEHVRIYLRSSYQQHTARTLQASLVVSGDCDVATKPAPLTLAWAVTVARDSDAWQQRGDDETAASGRFSRYDLLDATSPTATGIQIHRSSEGCANTNVALAAGTPAYLGLDIHGDGSGVALAASQAAVPMPGSGAGDRHVRLYLAAGANAPAGVLAVTATISAGCAGSGATPQQLVYRLTVFTPAAHAWEVLDDDRQTPGSSFDWSAMASNPVATGIQLHRNSEDCKMTDVVLLSGAEHFELVRHTSAGAVDGAAATRHAGVRMEEGAAADRHVRLRFRTGALPPPAVTARVRVAAAAGCGTRRNPAPATFSYVLNVDADFDPAPQLRVTPLSTSIARNAATTGIRATATDNDDTDVAVTLDAAAARIFELRGAAGRYELLVRTDVSLAVGGYTVVFTATDDNGGPAVTTQATATIMVREGSGGATGAAAVDAGGAVVRALGMGGIDAILDRPAPEAGAGTALLEMLAAKEHELERGEIDLAEFLEGQAVALPLSQNPSPGGAGFGVWVAGSRRDVGGVAEDADDVEVYVDGETTSANFGLDFHAGRVRVGLGYGLHETTATYGREEGRTVDDPSEYELGLQLLQPYLAFDFGGGRAALAVATGSGDMVLRPDGEAERELEADYLGYAVGVAQRLPLFGGGELRLRGSYAAGELDVAEPEGGATAAASMDSEGNSLRMVVGYGHEIAAGQAASFTPFVETGYLLLDGDGATASSALLQGGLEFTGGPLAGGVSYQHAISDDVTLAGYDLALRFGQQFGGLGLGFEADPGYGLAGAAEMLADLGAGEALALDEYGGGLRGGAGVSYGLAVDGGLLTPYGRWNADSGNELGLRLRAGERRSWALGYGAAADKLKIEFRLGG